MNIEDFRDYCLLKAGVTEETPFGPDTLVFKVGGKVFALTDINTFGSINLKCDPERAQEPREQHEYVLPGFHMNKKHWNTVLMGTGIPGRQLRELIDHSYDLVRASLPRKHREELAVAEQEAEIACYALNTALNVQENVIPSAVEESRVLTSDYITTSAREIPRLRSE